MTQNETVLATSDRKVYGSQELVIPDCVEKLAATRLPISAIAAKLGVCENTFYTAREKNLEVYEAFKRGRAEACARLAATAEAMIGRDTAITAMALKQPSEHGGLGWIDERSIHVEHSGEVTVRAVEGAWQTREALIAKERKLLDEQVIEAEFSEVE